MKKTAYEIWVESLKSRPVIKKKASQQLTFGAWLGDLCQHQKMQKKADWLDSAAGFAQDHILHPMQSMFDDTVEGVWNWATNNWNDLVPDEDRFDFISPKYSSIRDRGKIKEYQNWWTNANKNAREFFDSLPSKKDWKWDPNADIRAQVIDPNGMQSGSFMGGGLTDSGNMLVSKLKEYEWYDRILNEATGGDWTKIRNTPEAIDVLSELYGGDENEIQHILDLYAIRGNRRVNDIVSRNNINAISKAPLKGLWNGTVGLIPGARQKYEEQKKAGRWLGGAEGRNAGYRVAPTAEILGNIVTANAAAAASGYTPIANYTGTGSKLLHSTLSTASFKPLVYASALQKLDQAQSDIDEKLPSQVLPWLDYRQWLIGSAAAGGMGELAPLLGRVPYLSHAVDAAARHPTVSKFLGNAGYQYVNHVYPYAFERVARKIRDVDPTSTLGKPSEAEVDEFNRREANTVGNPVEDLIETKNQFNLTLARQRANLGFQSGKYKTLEDGLAEEFKQMVLKAGKLPIHLLYSPEFQLLPPELKQNVRTKLLQQAMASDVRELNELRQIQGLPPLDIKKMSPEQLTRTGVTVAEMPTSKVRQVTEGAGKAEAAAVAASVETASINPDGTPNPNANVSIMEQVGKLSQAVSGSMVNSIKMAARSKNENVRKAAFSMFSSIPSSTIATVMLAAKDGGTSLLPEGSPLLELLDDKDARDCFMEYVVKPRIDNDDDFEVLFPAAMSLNVKGIMNDPRTTAVSQQLMKMLMAKDLTGIGLRMRKNEGLRDVVAALAQNKNNPEFVALCGGQEAYDAWVKQATTQLKAGYLDKWMERPEDWQQIFGFLARIYGAEKAGKFVEDNPAAFWLGALGILGVGGITLGSIFGGGADEEDEEDDEEDEIPEYGMTPRRKKRKRKQLRPTRKPLDGGTYNEEDGYGFVMQ